MLNAAAAGTFVLGDRLEISPEARQDAIEKARRAIGESLTIKLAA
jgi:hypothetical protein